MTKREEWSVFLGITVKRPDGTKLLKRKEHAYVYHVISSEYQPDKKYNTEKKACIGKLASETEGTMYPNENFEHYYPGIIQSLQGFPSPPLMSDTVKAGSFAVLKHIAKQEGFLKILLAVYDKKNAVKLLDILFFIITDESAVFSRYEAFMRCHMMSDSRIMTDVAISRFLSSVITDENINKFLWLWNKAHVSSQMVYIGYDSTNFGCEANIPLAEYGKAKDDKTKPQVNLAVAVNQKDTTPLDYELYPGSIVDMTECEWMLERMQDYGYTKVGFLFDRGYYTEDNIRFLNQKDYDFIMMADEDTLFVRKLIEELASQLRHDASLFFLRHDVSGVTVQRDLYGKTRYFHVFYDDVKASYTRRILNNKIAQLRENLDQLLGQKLRKNARLDSFTKFFELKIGEHTLRKGKKEAQYRVLESYTLRHEEIQKLMDGYGFFCIVSTCEANCSAALEIYRGRDNIEKFFRSIKWGMDIHALGVHSEQALAGKIHLLFLAGILRNRLLQASRTIKQETGNKRNFTVTGIIDQLEMIECTRSAQGSYRRRYALTAKQKTIFNALGFTEAELDQEVADFNVRVTH